MPNISLQIASTLTEWSLSTLRLRIADGTLKSADNNTANNKTMICFDSIKNDICIPLEPDDIELIKAADAGEPQAQNDLGVLFWRMTGRKMPFIGWNWRQSKIL